MKKLLILVLILILGAVTAVGTRSDSGRAQSIMMRHNAIDLPEHGLTIITASSPLFDAEMSKFLAHPGEDLSKYVEALKPFCAFLVNNSGQNVVAYKLKWELMRSDGTAQTKFSSTINPAKLTGEDSPAAPPVKGELGPGMSRLITWEPSLANILSSLRSQGAESAYRKKVTEFLTRMEEGLSQLTGSAASLTVSLDGAFFSDGTFVGPDTDNTFVEVQSYVEAKADLRRLVENGRREGKNTTEVLDQIRTAFDNVNVAPSERPAPADLKAVFMKMHVDDLQRMRKALGDESSAEKITQLPRRDAPRLRKR